MMTNLGFTNWQFFTFEKMAYLQIQRMHVTYTDNLYVYGVILGYTIVVHVVFKSSGCQGF